jgi:SAM-dependent methyltransferase
MRFYGVAKVTGDSKLQSEVLEDLSDARRYRRWLADLVQPFLGEDPIEIGSGTGDYALEWAPTVRRFTVTEADELRFNALKVRFAEHSVIETRRLVLAGDGNANDEIERRHSSTVAINVLEHIPDDVGALRTLSDLVRPGGAVILVVPAFPSAMSRFDRAIGHQRRYTKTSLRTALHQAGLAVAELRYVNPVGLIGWYVAVKALRRTPRNGALVRLYDRTVVPMARFLDRRFTVPFGQSVFAVARTPADGG